MTTCREHGRVKGDTCPVCGTKYVKADCIACAGVGKDASGTCVVCDGSGWVWVPADDDCGKSGTW